MEKKLFDCAVIGSGPGGYVAAIRAAHHNLKTVLIEDTFPGGTCLNRGCIPSKALIAGADILRKVRKAGALGIKVEGISIDYSAMNAHKNRVVSQTRAGLEGLIKQNRITLLKGRGKLISSTEIAIIGQDECNLFAKSIILATGSEPLALPGMPFGPRLISSTELLELTVLPESLIIIGGGVIGCEIASLYATLGVKVTIIEMRERLLAAASISISTNLEAAFKKENISIFTSTRIVSVKEDVSHITVTLDDGTELTSELALSAAGRRFNTEDIGLEDVGVITTPQKAIPVSATMQTNIPNIYAVGDITGQWLLAHTASHQGLIAADHIAGKPSASQGHATPVVFFTNPEIASVGYTEEEAVAAGFVAKTATFHFSALGKSRALFDDNNGFVEIVWEIGSERILGGQAIGMQASNLIGEIAVAVYNELTLPCIYDTIHPHPTLSEAWVEVCLIAAGKGVHALPTPSK
ncbi:Dihydrolipoyl dehydrogenase [Candidatus Clavichlamydia salmonicola]|uniref:dihydrolipoyl dehydrogenase n=1 Tax=Candidatus Clavichlamydia salmonicola TaxID=469812 RepID=UPI001890CD67|nr:dihydrolipoyl dehydrogenase [Candidatus Clavichlamydia salmonicola]MBF5050558.1 Dihydrolipoyl dehydrogenase [Candidatus Clavichlamydia salmonicola]